MGTSAWAIESCDCAEHGAARGRSKGRGGVAYGAEWLDGAVINKAGPVNLMRAVSGQRVRSSVSCYDIVAT
jgi:hypothetical protein